MRRALLAVAVLVTVLLARLDSDTTSFRDLLRWENVPALVVYMLVIWAVLLGVRRLFARRREA